MKLLSEHFSDELFNPKTFGSDSCERFCACLCFFYRGKLNSCMLDVLDICGRILKLDEFEYKGIGWQEVNSSYWLTTAEKEILEGLQKAEKDVIKMVEKLDLLPLLIAGNILRKDKEGDIIYLNSGVESTLLPEVSVESNEPDTFTMEELVAGESDILCSVAEEIEHSLTCALSGIVASSTQRPGVGKTDWLENEEFDDNNPSNCHSFIQRRANTQIRVSKPQQKPTA